MPCLSAEFDPAIGPLIYATLAPAGTMTPETVGQSVRARGLLDTGASITCISPAVVARFALEPTGREAVSAVTHESTVNSYVVDFGIYFEKAVVPLLKMPVVEFPQAAGVPYEVIVGRDVIGHGVFSISFDHRFTFAV